MRGDIGFWLVLLGCTWVWCFGSFRLVMSMGWLLFLKVMTSYFYTNIHVNVQHVPCFTLVCWASILEFSCQPTWVNTMPSLVTGNGSHLQAWVLSICHHPRCTHGPREPSARLLSWAPVNSRGRNPTAGGPSRCGCHGSLCFLWCFVGAQKCLVMINHD